MTFNSLIDASPVPENRAKLPKEVKKINKWLGVSQNSEILKDILEVAAAIINIKENKQTIEGNNKGRDRIVLFSFINSKTSLFHEILLKFNCTLVNIIGPKKFSFQPIRGLKLAG